MHGHFRVLLYGLLGLLIISSVLVAMPGVFHVHPGMGNAITSSSTPELATNQYRFALGEERTIRGIQFTFLKVESDKRCAAGATDCTPGPAEISMQLDELGSSETVRIDSDAPSIISGFQIKLVDLSPAPATGETNPSAVLQFDDISIAN